LEICILCHIANTFLEEGKLDDYKRLIDEAIHDLAGFGEVQRILASAKESASAVDVAPLLGQPARPRPQA
jgi:hypothetical protein